MNPQAFPSSMQNAMNGHPLEEMKGMDLRDYFAAKAFAVILADRSVNLGPHEMAEWAYKYADALLVARN